MTQIFNIEVEKYILGCLILDKKCADYIPQLDETDFQEPTIRSLFIRASNLYEDGKKIDILNVSGGDTRIINFLAEISGAIPTIENFQSHFEELKFLSLRRKSYAAGGKIQDIAVESDFDSPLDFKNEVMRIVDIPVYNSKKSIYRIDEILGTVIMDIESRMNNKNDERLYTGFYDLDKITAGLHPEEMTIVAARPGIGKTAFLLQLMRNLVKKKVNCVLFSREMSKGQLGERLLSSFSGIDSQKIRFAKSLNDDEYDKISRSLGVISEMPLIINDEAVNVQEIKAFCREMKSKGMLDVVAVDYLQLCKTLKKTQSREREVAEMSWEFKMLAKEFKVPVIVLSQLSRDSAKDGRRPVLSDLRDSGAIEQDADNVMFLHVPKDTDETKNIFDIEVILAKQRQGPTGKIYLGYCRSNFNFFNKSNRG